MQRLDKECQDHNMDDLKSKEQSFDGFLSVKYQQQRDNEFVSTKM